MLPLEQNERLTRVGPGTVMGEVFRRFWLPVCQLADVVAGGAPVPIRLLGEDLLAYHTPGGGYGLIDRFCAHRGADLQYARNEPAGLRCIYHGWQYNSSGACVDLPNVREGAELAPRMAVKAYPVRAEGGLLWTYMGPAAQQPPFPILPWTTFGDAHWSGHFMQIENEGNFFQHIEGLCDGSHVGFLHANLDAGGGDGRFTASATFTDRVPRWKVLENTDYGAMLGLERDSPDGRTNLRLNQFVLPFTVLVPTPPPFEVASWQTCVPIDDENMMFLYTFWYDKKPIQQFVDELNWHGKWFTPPELIPGTYKPVLNRFNRYGQDRGEYMQKQSFSGIRNVRLQDTAASEYVRGGLIADRSAERLVSSDRAIVQVRRRMLELADRFEATGDLSRETKALATTRVVPLEENFAAGQDPAAIAKAKGVMAVA